MAQSTSLHDTIMSEYSDIRLQALIQADERRQDIYDKQPKLYELDAKVAGESIKAALAGSTGDKKALDELRDKISLYKKEKEDLIRAAGYSPLDMQPKFRCEDCKDTGYIGMRRCHCYTRRLLELAYERSGLSSVLDKENFDNFNLDYYSKTYVDDDGVCAYDNAAMVLARCKEYCDNFTGHDNILLSGKPGVGKTYLTHCMAKSLLDSMQGVIYLTADELISVFEQDTFDRDYKLDYDKTLLFDVDVLIIDDLGTEFINSFTSAKIFTCINERLLREKSTIISTNLSIQELLEIYSERTFSRLSQFTMLKLYGDDIRILKKAI